MAILFMTSANLMQFIFQKIMCLMIVGMYKMHANEINIKNRVYNYYFDNFIKAKLLETKDILINEINYKDSMVYFTRYVFKKSIKMLSLHHHELMGKTEEQ